MPGPARLLPAIVAASLALAGCGSRDGPLAVAVIDSEEQLFAGGLRLSYGGQIVRAATGSGLVALNAQGDVVPALADRWIVADDGRSYIFRLRDGDWPGGSDLTGESARDSLRRVLRELRGTSLGLDLAPVSEVRAMAGRVVEIRLSQPMPDFLRLLAQPELALSQGTRPSGPMLLDRDGEEAAGGGVLTFRPPEARGLPQDERWEEYVRPVAVSAAGPAAALAAFENAEVDVVLGGGLGAWPLADPGPLTRGTRRIDPAIGLFGLLVRSESGFLARAENREALAMAIDRPALLSPFNIGGWLATTRIVPAAIAGEGVTERWDGIGIERLRGEARRRVQAWSAGSGGAAPVVTVALSDEPGYAALFNQLARQWAEIGVTLRRVEDGKPADLVLVDSVARYAAPLWFLNQFNCTLRRGMCSSEADSEVRQALAATDLPSRAGSLARAEAMLTAANVYIPLAMPLRWSLVRGNVEGYFANQWAWHPLPDMAVIPR